MSISREVGRDIVASPEPHSFLETRQEVAGVKVEDRVYAREQLLDGRWRQRVDILHLAEHLQV